MSTDENSPTMGQQYAELQQAQRLGSHLLGPDGKIIYPSSYDARTFDDCVNTSKSPSSTGKEIPDLEKTPNRLNDVANASTASEMMKVCPKCKKEFSSLSNTYRHLVNGKI